jgi:hypothetical protein
MALTADAEPLQLINPPEPTAATREALRFAPPPAMRPETSF